MWCRRPGIYRRRWRWPPQGMPGSLGAAGPFLASKTTAPRPALHRQPPEAAVGRRQRPLACAGSLPSRRTWRLAAPPAVAKSARCATFVGHDGKVQYCTAGGGLPPGPNGIDAAAQTGSAGRPLAPEPCGPGWARPAASGPRVALCRSSSMPGPAPRLHATAVPHPALAAPLTRRRLNRCAGHFTAAWQVLHRLSTRVPKCSRPGRPR